LLFQCVKLLLLLCKHELSSNHVSRTIDVFNRVLIAVITHILFVTFFNMFVFHLQVDVDAPLLLNASLHLVLSIDYSDWWTSTPHCC